MRFKKDYNEIDRATEDHFIMVYTHQIACIGSDLCESLSVVSHKGQFIIARLNTRTHSGQASGSMHVNFEKFRGSLVVTAHNSS